MRPHEFLRRVGHDAYIIRRPNSRKEERTPIGSWPSKTLRYGNPRVRQLPCEFARATEVNIPWTPCGVPKERVMLIGERLPTNTGVCVFRLQTNLYGLFSSFGGQPYPLIVAFVVFLLAAVAAASLIWRLAQDEHQDRRARASALVRSSYVETGKVGRTSGSP